jgi:hypothetical protein
MPVTFGTVQLVPASSAPPSTNPTAPATSATAAQAPDPRDLAPALRHLHERAARLRAH